MRNIQRLSSALLVLLALTSAHGQVTVTKSFPAVNKFIPDGYATGVADTRTIEATGISSITDIQVQLTIASGFNGDLYCYLVHDSGFVVLLNRPGRSCARPLGYKDAGFSAVFSSRATKDFHCYRDLVPAGFVLPGVWSPDARASDPVKTLDTSARTKDFMSFAGLNPNGQWTLFVADMSSGGQALLKDWGLVISGTPESAPELRVAKAPAPVLSQYQASILR
jgi:subtilisin-like proprotein convertase family protein